MEGGLAEGGSSSSCTSTPQREKSECVKSRDVQTARCEIFFSAISAVFLSSLGASKGEADLDAVCEACLPYLSCRQPSRLQEACRSVFRHLVQVDPDAFWFTLNELHCPSSYIPPHPDLHAVQLNGMGRLRDECSDNVLKLLREEFGPITETINQPIS